MDTAKITRIASFGLMAIGLVMLGNVFINSESAVGPFIQLGYICTSIAVVAAVVFSVLNLFKGGNSKNTLIGIGAVAGILIIAYLVSSGADFAQYTGEIAVTEGTSKMVSAGLNSFYIFLFIAVISILYTEVTKAFK